MKRSLIISTLLLAVVACGKHTDEHSSNHQEKETLSEEEIPSVYVWPEGSKYYYAFEEKIFLKEVANKIVVSFDEKYLSKLQQHLQKNDQIRYMELFYFNNGYILTTTEDSNVNALMKDLKKQAGIKSVNPMYANSNGSEMGITDEIIVQFKEDVEYAFQQRLDEIHKKYQVEIKKITEFYQIFSVPIDFDPLEVANAYQESGLVNFSHPDFITKVNNNP